MGWIWLSTAASRPSESADLGECAKALHRDPIGRLVASSQAALRFPDVSARTGPYAPSTIANFATLAPPTISQVVTRTAQNRCNHLEIAPSNRLQNARISYEIRTKIYPVKRFFFPHLSKPLILR